MVPPNQAELMFQALKERGIPAALVLFEGEQHGFRQAPNIRRARCSMLVGAAGGPRCTRLACGKLLQATVAWPMQLVESKCSGVLVQLLRSSQCLPTFPQSCGRARASSARPLLLPTCMRNFPPCPYPQTPVQAGPGWRALLLRSGAGLQPSHAQRLRAA